jgi:hypothetical protein
MYKQFSLALIIRPLTILVVEVSALGVNCYQVKEFSFSASKPYSKPWSDVNLIATFTGPGGSTYNIPGFWDGGVLWRVRFAPTVSGEWSYETTCVEDNGLDGHSGSFTVGPASGDNPLFLHGGFLKVSDNGRYLTYTDGKPFFWLGDTWWYSPGDDMPFDESSNSKIESCFKHCVDKRKSQGYTIVHFGFLDHLKGYANPIRFYLTHEIQPGYWREFDKYVNYKLFQN